jgi:hypothetical protein
MIHELRREQAAERVFNLRIRKIEQMLKGVVVKTAGKPLQGPWYYIYLRPKWEIRTMPMDSSSTMDHPQFWRTIVDDSIVPHYGVKDPVIIRELKNLPYAMPRGRVASVRKLGGGPQWVAYYGQDYKYNRQEMLRILGEFNLLPQFQAGLARFVPDEHEVIVRHDFERFNRMVNLTPKETKRINIQDPAEEID